MSRRAWLRRAWIVALAFLLTVPAVTTRLYAADEIEYFAFLRSFWFDRDLSFENEYRYFYERGYTRDPGFVKTFLEEETITGLRPNYGTVGSAILWSPFYLAADGGVRLAGLFGRDVPANGFSQPYLTAVTWASACYGWLALILAVAIARRLGASGTLAAIIVGLGTPLVFYMYVAPGMAHATSAFAVALFVYVWLRARETWNLPGVAALAATGALVAMVREQDAFLIVVPVADYLWTMAVSRASIRDRAQAAGVRLILSAIVFVVCYLPQVFAYLALNGRIGPSPVIAAKMHWTAPWAGSVLASPEHGWLLWTPLVVLALAGLVMMAVRPSPAVTGARRLALLLLLAVATQVYVSGSVESWTLAGAFGQRRFVGLTVCLVVGIAWLLARVPSGGPKRLALGVCAVAVWWNLGLAFQFGAGLMNRQRLELGRNAYATFVDVPLRLPEFAWRYLFDRASFYENRPAGSGQ
jgi:hypothetical protein